MRIRKALGIKKKKLQGRGVQMEILQQMIWIVLRSGDPEMYTTFLYHFIDNWICLYEMNFTPANIIVLMIFHLTFDYLEINTLFGNIFFI